MDQPPDHEHGHKQLERLAFFSDAVFAIAMTLLVIDVRLPPLARESEAGLGQALINLIPNYIGFVVSFVVIGRFWLAHHRIFGLLARTSDRLIWINLLLLMTIAFMPFPTAVLSDHVQLRVAVMFYAGWLLVIGLIQRALVTTALGSRSILVREDVPLAERAHLLRGSWIAAVIGTLSIAGAAVSAWLGMAILMVGSPIVFRVLHRRRKLP